MIESIEIGVSPLKRYMVDVSRAYYKSFYGPVLALNAQAAIEDGFFRAQDGDLEGGPDRGTAVSEVDTLDRAEVDEEPIPTLESLIKHEVEAGRKEKVIALCNRLYTEYALKNGQM